MILIKNTTIITQNVQRQIIQNGAILIEDEKIADIGPTKKLEKKYVKAAKKIIDGKEKVVMPGLINAHTHAAMTLLRGYADDLPLNDWLTKKIWPAEAELKPKDIFDGTKLACQEMLRSGTTTFNNMYWYPAEEIKAVVKSESCRLARDRGTTYNIFLRDFVGIVAFDISPMNFGPAYIEKTFQKLKAKVNKNIKLTIAPHAIYTVSEKTLQWCKKFADQNKLLLHIHLAETEKEVQDCLKKYNCRPLEYLEKIGFLGKNVIAAHACWLTDQEIKILAKRKVSIAHCPTSNLKLASGIMPLTKLLKAGVNVCLGTDGPASNNSLDMFSEMKIAALIHKWNERNPEVADVQTILDLATINGAKALGMEKEIGSLEIDKNADLVIVNFKQPHLKPCFNVVSHLVYAAKSSDVETVLKSGQVLY